VCISVGVASIVGGQFHARAALIIIDGVVGHVEPTF
jgi:hypothetical protein